MQEHFRNNNILVETVRLYKNHKIPLRLSEFSAVVSLGSTATTYVPETNPHHEQEIELFQQIRALTVPSFTVCYSMQMFSIANGGRVTPNPKGKEVGFFDIHLTKRAKDDLIFSRLPSTYKTLQWHGDCVTRLPRGSTLLAYSAKTENQAAVLDGIHYLIQGDGQAATHSQLKSYLNHDRKWAGLTLKQEHKLLSDLVRNNDYFHDCFAKMFSSFLELISIGQTQINDRVKLPRPNHIRRKK